MYSGCGSVYKMYEGFIVVRLPGTNIYSASGGNHRTFTASVTRGSVYCGKVITICFVCGYGSEEVSLIMRSGN